MTTDLYGQIFALTSAIAWAFAVVLFKRSGDTIAPLPLNLFKNAVALVLLFATLPLVGESFAPLRDHPIEDTYILIISGVVGITVADTIFFRALNLCGVGIISIVDCTYAPFTIFFSFLLLSEQLTGAHYVGGGLILLGILISTRHTPPSNRTRGQLLLGIVLGVTGMALMAIAIVFAKPVLEVADYPLILATLMRMLGGTLALAVMAIASPQRRRHWSVFRPSRSWRDALPASFLGGYLSMVLWVAGFKYTDAGIASILNQTTVVFAIILATFILHEKLTLRKALAVIVALAGVMTIVLQNG